MKSPMPDEVALLEPAPGLPQCHRQEVLDATPGIVVTKDNEDKGPAYAPSTDERPSVFGHNLPPHRAVVGPLDLL